MRCLFAIVRLTLFQSQWIEFDWSNSEKTRKNENITWKINESPERRMCFALEFHFCLDFPVSTRRQSSSFYFQNFWKSTNYGHLLTAHETDVRRFCFRFTSLIPEKKNMQISSVKWKQRTINRVELYSIRISFRSFAFGDLFIRNAVIWFHHNSNWYCQLKSYMSVCKWIYIEWFFFL